MILLLSSDALSLWCCLFVCFHSDVLNLPIFKDEPTAVFQNMETIDLDSSAE